MQIEAEMQYSNILRYTRLSLWFIKIRLEESSPLTFTAI